MKHRGRPRLEIQPYVFNVKLRLRQGEDDDLIDFLTRIPARKLSVAVKAAMRSGSLNPAVAADDLPDDDLTDALNDLLF